VAHYLWLSGTQMIDGLALGETTPGSEAALIGAAGLLLVFIKAWLVRQGIFL
jgi:chromate transporter